MCKNGCSNSCSCENTKEFTSNINYDGNTIPCLDINGDIKPPYTGLNALLDLITTKLCELNARATSFINSYIEVLTAIDLGVADPNWNGDNSWFIPTAYSTLTYTNNSGLEKTFFIQVNYLNGKNDIAVGAYGLSDVDSGLFLNTDLLNPIYDVSSKVQINDGGVPTLYLINQNNTYFKKVTLLDGEGVTVQFKTKSIGTGHLQKAQMFVKEL
jgi:hypothetical protein